MNGYSFMFIATRRVRV